MYLALMVLSTAQHCFCQDFICVVCYILSLMFFLLQIIFVNNVAVYILFFALFCH
jgi:hypothetical protein